MKTYILKWNPDISSVTMERYENELIDKEWPEYNWSFWDYKDAQAGDKFYMLRVGEGNTGVVMSGTLISEAYQSEDWSGKGRTVFYCDIAPDFILHPDKCPIITTEQLQQAMPDFQPVEQPAPDFTPADQAIPEMQQPSFQQGPVPFVEQAIPAFPQDAQPVEQMAPEFQEQPTISQESMLPVEQAMPFFQDQPSGQSDYLQQAVRGDDAVMPEFQEPAFAEPIVQPVGQVQPYAPEAAGIEFAPEVQMPADQADFSAQPTSFMPTIGQEEAIPFGQPTQVMEPVSAAQFEQPTQFMEPVPDMSVEQVEAAKKPAYAKRNPLARHDLPVFLRMRIAPRVDHMQKVHAATPCSPSAGPWPARIRL